MCAEPISLLYEKRRMLHRCALDQREAEMMAFSREWDRAARRTDSTPVSGRRQLSKVITQIPIA